MLEKKTIVLGITGSVAAYKACDLISVLRKEKADIFVVMTKNAAKLVTPSLLKALSQNIVYLDEFDEKENMPHISLAKKADLLIIAPATANIISKAANGIADDLLTTTILSVNIPVIFAPAMNTEMWKKEIIQENIKILKNRGYCIVGPVEGELACGDYGIGKMAPLEEILNAIDLKLNKKKELSGVRILITAGGTRERIDDVRYIGNFSSGKMGYFIAKEAVESGADVTYIIGASDMLSPDGVKLIKIESSSEMRAQVLKSFKDNDVLIMSAAISDFKPREKIQGKVKRELVRDKYNVSFIKTDDILKEAGARKGKKIIFGFSLGSNGVVNEARKKLKEKNLDYILANTIKSIGTDSIDAVLLDKSGKTSDFGTISKEECAKKIIEKIRNVCRSRRS